MYTPPLPTSDVFYLEWTRVDHAQATRTMEEIPTV